MNPTRIVIVAKSPISRSLIGRRLVALPGIELVGEAVSLADAKRVIETSRPHIAVLGPSLAASREFKDLRDLLIAMPCRWIEIAGLNTAADSDGLARDGRHLPVLTHGMTQTQTEKALAEVMAAPVDRATSSETAPAFRRTPDAQTTEPANRFILIGASTGVSTRCFRFSATSRRTARRRQSFSTPVAATAAALSSYWRNAAAPKSWRPGTVWNCGAA